VLLMRGVLLGSALLALILTVLIVGVVRLTGMVVPRVRGRTTNLTAERCFAEAVAAGDFDRAEQQAAFLLEPPPGPAARSSQLGPTREGEPEGGSILLLPPLSNPPLRNRRCMAWPVVAWPAGRLAVAGVSGEQGWQGGAPCRSGSRMS
jgi:hypothetical protein